MKQRITIVGGGLAGLTLGIGLRQRDVPVTIWEAGRYPRHRVCGEFICGNGPAVLQRLGLLEILENAGAFRARTAMFVAGSNRSPVRQLSTPALCLSRFAMDTELAGEFRRLGGELRESERWNSMETGGVVHACGRRPQPTANGWRWFGLKAHAKDLDLSADLEMHVSAGGYVGVNRIGNGEVNVCGLFRARNVPPKSCRQNRNQKTSAAPQTQFQKQSGFTPTSEVPSPPRATSAFGLNLLFGEAGSPLRERLAGAELDEHSFCSVAGLDLKPRRASDQQTCSIGDALTMIPPVTGNGMSMAFESAEIAVEPLAAFSRGEMNWAEARATIARSCDLAFARRLAWARWVQWLMFSPMIRGRLGGALLRSDWLWRLMFTRTR